MKKSFKILQKWKIMLRSGSAAKPALEGEDRSDVATVLHQSTRELLYDDKGLPQGWYRKITKHCKMCLNRKLKKACINRTCLILPVADHGKLLVQVSNSGMTQLVCKIQLGRHWKRTERLLYQTKYEDPPRASAGGRGWTLYLLKRLVLLQFQLQYHF